MKTERIALRAPRRLRLPGLRDLPLFWKLLVPFFVLMLILGSLGGFLIVRDLSSRAQAALDQELSRRSLEARSVVRDREVYLLESANLGANLQGMSQAIPRRDVSGISQLLGSVLALKGQLTLVVATDSTGLGIVEFTRGRGASSQGARWSKYDFVARATKSSVAEGAEGLITIGGKTLLAIAAPVCSGATSCLPVGAVIMGIPLDALVAEVATSSPAGSGVAVYSADGRLMAANVGHSWPSAAPALPASGLLRRTQRFGTTNVTALYAPFDVNGTREGSIAVALPESQAFSAAKGAGFRLALILLAAMAGVVALGALLSRGIMAQVRPLLATNRALGSGNLHARAPVIGRDELAELAAGVNQMADQLQANVQTLEHRVEERTEEIQRLLTERSDFFAGLSHELRTPIAVVLSHAEMLMEPDYKKGLRWNVEAGKTLKDSGEQLLGVVNDILELAKAEAGRIEIQPEPMRLEAAVKDVRRTIEGLAKAGGQSLTFDLPRGLPLVLADRVRLREIILNLADNATKYTPRGGRIELSAVAEDGHAVFRVSDTGVGIPADAAQRIFEPFYRVEGTKPQRSQPSSGLGLALTKRLVEAHGGEIGFENRRGGGTIFSFTLPVAPRSE